MVNPRAPAGRNASRRGGRAEVTVIVSVYGGYGRREALVAVLSRWQRQSARPAVLLSEQAVGRPRFAGLAKALGVQHVVSRPEIEAGAVRYDIGRVRNAGIAAARSPLLYMTDADVYPIRQDYLAGLQEQAERQPTRIWYRPRMFRLAESAVPRFLEFMGRPDARLRLPEADGCLCTFAGSGIELRPEVAIDLAGWDHVCTPAALTRLRSASFDPAEVELLTKPQVHWGGSFLRKAAAEVVGGYAEGYYGWGCEDDDFHAKLAGSFMLNRISERAVIHFEHPRPYNNAAFSANEHRYEMRRRAGAAAMIAADRQARREAPRR